jgi:hypothetical protein
MFNTFKIESVDERQVILTWHEDQHLATAARKLLELRKRYPHLTFTIQPHQQIVSNYA